MKICLSCLIPFPLWPIHSYSGQRNTSRRRAANSQITIAESNSLIQKTDIRRYRSGILSNRLPAYLTTGLVDCYLCRCKCYDMYKEVIPFAEAWSWQKSIVEQRKTLIDRNEDCSDTLILLQHQPVYTLGTASSQKKLNVDIKDPPLPLYQTERGGEVTYHGPGQLLLYPIMNLRFQKMDLHWYLRALEEVVIRVLFSAFSLKASRVEGFTGVWVGDKKVAAIGIRVSKWLTYHGLALNVSTDLSPFNKIIPCGIKDRGVGSIKELLRESNRPSKFSYDDDELIDIAHESLLKEFCQVFQLELCHESLPILMIPDK